MTAPETRRLESLEDEYGKPKLLPEQIFDMAATKEQLKTMVPPAANRESVAHPQA